MCIIKIDKSRQRKKWKVEWNVGEKTKKEGKSTKWHEINEVEWNKIFPF